MAFEQEDELLQFAEHVEPMAERLPAGLNGRVGETRRRDEQPAHLASAKDADEVLRDVSGADSLLQPLHLDKVEVTVELDHAVDLLDDALVVVAEPREGVADGDPVEREQLVEHLLKPSRPLVGINVSEEGGELLANRLALEARLHHRRQLLLFGSNVLDMLALALEIDPGEGVLDVDDTADLSHQRSGLVDVLRPASREAVGLGDPLDHFPSRPESRVAGGIEALERGADYLVLEDAVAVSNYLRLQIPHQGVGHTRPTQEQKDVALRPAERRDGIDEQGEKLGRIVECLVERRRRRHAHTVLGAGDGGLERPLPLARFKEPRRRMADSKETNGPAAKPEPKPARIIELRTHPPCVRRHGRATLTISRAGRLGDHVDLAEPIEAYRDGRLSAGDLACAFVRARVEKHSPTFSWENADRDRLTRLVVDCSEEPKFESAEPEAVAQTIVAAHDKEKEQLREIAQMFSRSFANTLNLKSFLPPTYLGWADQQRRTFDSIQQMLGAGQLTEITKQFAGLSHAIGVAQQTSALGAAGQLAKQMQEQRMAAARGLALRGPMLNAAFDLRQTPLRELSGSLERTMDALQIRPLKLPPQAFLNREVTVAEVLGAAEEAADVMAEHGADEQASELRVVTDEVREVVESPSTERLEEMMVHLTGLVEVESRKRAESEERMNERLDVETDERRRDASEALILALFLFFLGVMLQMFISLLGLPTIIQ